MVISERIRDKVYLTAAKHYGTSLSVIRFLAAQNESFLDISSFKEDKYWSRFASSLSSSKKPPKIWAADYVNHAPVNKQVLRIISDLRSKGYVLAALSNAIPPRLSLNRKRKLYDIFDSTTFSCEPGVDCKKPNSKIYRICLQRLNLPPEECIFIDDRKENLAAAKKLGLGTIHFKSASHLKKELKKILPGKS